MTKQIAQTYRILLVEDQILVLGALATLLKLDKTIDSVEVASDAETAIAMLKNKFFDLIVSDIEMPGLSGIELCQKVGKEYPNIKRLLITTFRRSGYVKRALECKVDGFLLKDSPPDMLIKSITDIMQGKRVFDPELLLDTMDSEDPLNPKERKALQLAKQGKSNQEIADELFLSLGTIKNYISSCIAKLGANNRIEAIRTADKKGLL